MSLSNQNPLKFIQLPFFPLSSGDQLLSIMFAAPSGFANVSGILPSGEANFLDFSQTETILNKASNITPRPWNDSSHYNQSIVAPNNLEFYQSNQFVRDPPFYIDTSSFTTIQALSNAKNSRDYSINDFSIFNPYVHYDHSGIQDPSGPATQVTDPFAYAFTFDPSSFITLGTIRFNLYSTQYRV